MSTDRRHLILSLSIAGLGFHPGAAVLGAGEAHRLSEVGYYRQLLQTAERGLFDFVLLQDERALQPGQSFGRIDALALLSRLAPESKHIGLAISKPTTNSEPFHVSRELATLDFVSGGRAAWNVTTIASDAEAANFGSDRTLPALERLAIAEEFVEVSRKLWDSWEDGAVVTDRASGLYLDSSKLHHINHVGNHFRIRGPQITYRPPQGHVVIVQIDAGDAGSPLSVETADVLILHHESIGQAKRERTRLQEAAAAHGREVKVLQAILPILGVTEENARARAAALEAAAQGHTTPLPNAHRFVGTPQQLADRLELWFAQEATDGFHFLPASLPQGIEELAFVLSSEVQARGLFRTEYTGRTLRDHLGLSRPLSQYASV